MGRKGKLIIAAMAGGLFLAGFALGQSVQADSTTPGSVSDPLVSQSYVRSQVVSKTQELQQKVTELEAKSAALEAKLKQLEALNQ